MTVTNPRINNKIMAVARLTGCKIKLLLLHKVQYSMVFHGSHDVASEWGLRCQC